MLTPEGEVFNGEVEMLSTRTEIGEVGVLANHAPLLATLDPADLRLHLSETEIKRYAQGEGYLQVFGNRRWCWWRSASSPSASTRRHSASSCAKPKRCSPASTRKRSNQRVREARTTAERDEARELTAEYDRALADSKRAEIFLRIAGESD